MRCLDRDQILFSDMYSQRNERLFLDDINDSIQAIESFVKGMTREDLIKDRKSFSATIRELEIIGEAVTMERLVDAKSLIC